MRVFIIEETTLEASTNMPSKVVVRGRQLRIGLGAELGTAMGNNRVYNRGTCISLVSHMLVRSCVAWMMIGPLPEAPGDTSDLTIHRDAHSLRV